MPHPSRFPSDYFTARDRFRELAHAAGCDLEAHSISARGPEGEELTIDAAILGPADAPRTVVVSAGLHGVEGPFGSAVQLALLEGPGPRIAGLRLVFLHALNPYGFAWGRRTNEDNVDLNRNWLRPGEPYRGSPALYARLDPVFNPASPPRPPGLLKLRIVVAAARFGTAAIRQALPVGQYDRPRGLFFGGRAPAETHEIVRARLARWVGEARQIVHLDFHTGLGRWGTGKLLVDAPAGAAHAAWFRAHYGTELVSAADAPSGPAYPTRGAWGPWCAHVLPGRAYRFATAEFGTYGPLRVLAALVTENRAHFHCQPGAPRLAAARARLADTFVPQSPRWRRRVLEQGVALVRRAMAGGAADYPEHGPGEEVSL